MSAESESDARAHEAARFCAAPWHFVKGVVALEGLPDDGRPEVAFAGRSNVGKSSLINAILSQGTLARASNTPGRTQELNLFAPRDGTLYLVDMPGYGFAEAPRAKVEAWGRLVRDYLAQRVTLRRAFVLVDARHGLKAIDTEMMAMLDAAGVAYRVVLTKADKISQPALAERLAAVEAALTAHPAAMPEVIVTSAEKRTGLEALRDELYAIAHGL